MIKTPRERVTQMPSLTQGHCRVLILCWTYFCMDLRRQLKISQQTNPTRLTKNMSDNGGFYSINYTPVMGPHLRCRYLPCFIISSMLPNYWGSYQLFT